MIQKLCLTLGLVLVATVAFGDSIPEAAVVKLQVVVCTGDGCLVVSRGSAVCLAPLDGKVWLLTAKHCLPEKPRERMQVFIRNEWVAADCRNVSKRGADLALIVADAPDCDGLACLATTGPGVGEPVTVAGYILGRELGIRTGTVEATGELVDTLQIPAIRNGPEIYGGSVFPGESGCGVFDKSGDLVGITIEHYAESPWVGRYVNLSEVRRFVAAAGIVAPVVPVPPTVPAEPPRGPSPYVRPGLWDGPLSLDPIEPPQRAPVVPVEPLPVAPAVVPPVVAPPEPPKIAEPLPGGREDAAETQGKPASGATGGNTKNSGFWSSLIPLGLAVAGTAVTGGAGWFTLVRPAVTTIRAGLAEIRQDRQPGPSGCFSVPPAGTPAPTQTPAPARTEASGPIPAAPFPRQLDEARSLVQLGQTEGRVPLLDALRGMFFDDELNKLADSGTPAAVEMVSQLRKSIQSRVDSAAPLSVKGL